MTDDLQALLAERALAPQALVPLARLETPANLTRTYRLDLPDGTRLKALESSSARRAATIEDALVRLRLPALPRVLGRRGRALLFEWIEGVPIGDEMLEAAAALLGTVHARSPAGLVVESHLEPLAAAARLAERTRRLVAAGLVDPDTAGRLLALAPPPPERPRFAHCDLCPENLLLADGALRIIDNGSWLVGPAGYDLGRTLWRWPMSAAGRARFLAAYRRAGGVAIAAEALAFWTGVAAVGGTFYRLGGPVADAARRLRQLV
ncbi:aminoglycoside phosphotransferase family protein [bacterium]|nr:aminoglycoside phosphotransferase family protein [bacterium]